MRIPIDAVSHLPDEAGVYMMLDSSGMILYIGKAKSLRKRVKQYTQGVDKRATIPYLMEKVVTVDVLVVPDEKEALLLENTLIKEHKPKYNALLKDDKTFVSLVIDLHHPFPKIDIIRLKGGAPDKKRYFGPYLNSYGAKQTLELINKVYKLRSCSDSEFSNRKRPCILHSIGQCSAPCTSLISEEAYRSHIDQAIKFLGGDGKEVIDALKEQIELASDALQFEKAAQLYSLLKQATLIISEPKALLQSAHRECDAIGIFSKGSQICLMKLSFREGKMVGASPYLFQGVVSTPEELITSFLLQEYEKPGDPREILVPFETDDLPILQTILKRTLIVPKKGEKKELVAIAERNAALYIQENEEEEKLLLLQETLHLSRYPVRIDCFDTSHMQGEHHVAARISYVDGVYSSKLTKLFHISEKHRGDDVKAIEEAIRRAYNNAESLPDLIVIDGGKTQLRFAQQALQELNLTSIDIISICKEEGRHDKGLTKERIFTSADSSPISLLHLSVEIRFLQKIRDESHRVAIEFYRKSKRKESFATPLDTIKGIGEAKKKILLSHFGSAKKALEASRSELEACKGLSQKDIDAIVNRTI